MLIWVPWSSRLRLVVKGRGQSLHHSPLRKLKKGVRSFHLHPSLPRLALLFSTKFNVKSPSLLPVAFLPPRKADGLPLVWYWKPKLLRDLTRSNKNPVYSSSIWIPEGCPSWLLHATKNEAVVRSRSVRFENLGLSQRGKSFSWCKLGYFPFPPPPQAAGMLQIFVSRKDDMSTVEHLVVLLLRCGKVRSVPLNL